MTRIRGVTRIAYAGSFPSRRALPHVMHGCWETLEGQPERGIRVRLTRASPDAAMLTTLSDLAATRRWVQKWQPFGASHSEARAMLANGGSRPTSAEDQEENWLPDRGPCRRGAVWLVWTFLQLQEDALLRGVIRPDDLGGDQVIGKHCVEQ
jgi:hypothetical protein